MNLLFLVTITNPKGWVNFSRGAYHFIQLPRKPSPTISPSPGASSPRTLILASGSDSLDNLACARVCSAELTPL